jgi:hypothetical protein
VVLQCCCHEFMLICYCGGLNMFVNGLRVTCFNGILVGLL